MSRIIDLNTAAAMLRTHHHLTMNTEPLPQGHEASLPPESHYPTPQDLATEQAEAREREEQVERVQAYMEAQRKVHLHHLNTKNAMGSRERVVYMAARALCNALDELYRLEEGGGL